jgi:4-amino-4-deoxy-L-arabinose transferase-like glycosyltransferase
VAALGLAGLVRLRAVLDVPPLTDEADEVLRGLAIARGTLAPLVNDDAYIGALFNYLVAGLFLVGGPSPLSPRALVLAAGLVTILLTYQLGRAIGGRWTGLLAALLLATAGLHIVVNSRVAWSHSLTPLFTTAALVSLLAALRRRSGPLLVLTGLWAGLAVQTHPSAVALLPALALATLSHHQGRTWLRRPWPYLAGLVALLVCANLLWFNLVVAPGQALREANAYAYAYQPKPSVGAYLAAMPQYGVDVVRAVGSVYGTRTTLTTYLTNPAFLVTAALLVAGLGLALARRRWLLPLVLVVPSLILLLVGRQFAFLPGDTARYLSFLLPVAHTLIALVVVTGANRLRRLAGRLPRPGWRRAGRVAALAIAMGVGLGLAWFPLNGTLAFEATYPRRDDTRQATAALEAAVAARQGPVYVDERLNRVLLFGGGHLQMAILYLMDLHDVPHRSLMLKAGQTGADLTALLTPGTIVIVHDETVPRLAPLPLTPLYVVSGQARGTRHGYGVYRVGGAGRPRRALSRRPVPFARPGRGPHDQSFRTRDAHPPPVSGDQAAVPQRHPLLPPG